MFSLLKSHLFFRIFEQEKRIARRGFRLVFLRESILLGILSSIHKNLNAITTRLEKQAKRKEKGDETREFLASFCKAE